MGGVSPHTHTHTYTFPSRRGEQQCQGVRQASLADRRPAARASRSPLLAQRPSLATASQSRQPAGDWEFLGQAAARPIGVCFPHFMLASEIPPDCRGGRRRGGSAGGAVAPSQAEPTSGTAEAEAAPSVPSLEPERQPEFQALRELPLPPPPPFELSASGLGQRS